MITGAAVVNLKLKPLYFRDYKEAYIFVKHRALNGHNYHIIQKGAIVSRGTIERSEKKWNIKAWNELKRKMLIIIL